MITSFKGEYAFLSNFWFSPVELGGVTFPTGEHAFHAAKCTDPADVQKIMAAKTPQQAKRIGKKVAIRPDWNDIRYDVMTAVVQAKFADSDLARRLAATGDEELIEGNNWGDRQWGMVNGEGENWLGIILMARRIKIQDYFKALDSIQQ
jgi:ribA/ribD-fused uncharacterized protein